MYILMDDINRPISLILEEPCKTWKIAWARSLGLYNYICGHMDFNSHTFRNDVMYNVIDDVAPHYLQLKHQNGLIGAQRDWQSNCKYGKPVQSKGGILAIVLFNLVPESSYSEFLEKCDNLSLREWTRQNVKFEFISSLIYSLQRDQTTSKLMAGSS